MMYNRYIPNPDGTFRREVVPDAPLDGITPEPVAEESSAPNEPAVFEQAAVPQRTAEQPGPGAPAFRKMLPTAIDTGDLLVLLILLLLLVDGDEDNYLSVLLTIAAFILL